MKNIGYLLKIATLFILLLSCSNNNTTNWPNNGTKIFAKKYKLAIEDTSKILIKNGNEFSLITPPDSLIINKFEISYESVAPKAPAYFTKNANQQVKNTSTPDIIEYYAFNNGNVLFVGYATGDSLRPYAIFKPPLIISPAKINKEVKSTDKMKIFNAKDNVFAEEYNASLLIRDIAQISVRNSKRHIAVCNLREMILTRDAAVGFGKNNLIVPDAIISKTKLLVNLKGYPVAEWSIKLETKNKEPEKLEEFEQNQKEKPYIEFIKYQESID